MAIDGTCLDVADTPANDVFFGRPGVNKGERSAFPQARVAALERHFTVERLGRQSDTDHLRLLPKAKDSDFRSVELWLKDGAPQRMRFDDPLGGANEVRFSDIRTNAPIEPKQFAFTIPKGAEVIQADGTPGR